MRLLVTGDRKWRDANRIEEVLSEVTGWATDEYTLLTGEAMGADIIADVVWQLNTGVTPERFPALWNEHGRSAGPIRNTQMLRSGVDYVVGFHDDIQNSRGTRDMLRQCARAGVSGRLFSLTREIKDWEGVVNDTRRRNP